MSNDWNRMVENKQNPYAAPLTTSPIMATARAEPLPTFVKTVAILDLVFCGLRVLFVAMGAIAVMQPDAIEDQNLRLTAPYEVATGACIALFGIIAGIGLLTGKRYAIIFGVLALAATVASTGVGGWQLSTMLDAAPQGAERTGMMIGGVFSILVRLGLIVLYGAALMRFSQWINRQEAQAAGW